jgi:ATP-binding cassette, subfamily C (CFTR/MRP), member 1
MGKNGNSTTLLDDIHLNADLSQGTVAALCGVQLAHVILWALPSNLRIRTALPSTILCFLATVVLAGMLFVEHKRSVGPAKLLSCYLIFSTLLDIVQARSLIMRGTYSALACLCIASIVAKTVLICLEEVPKRGLLTEKYRDAALESTSGGINRTVFWWLQSLFRKGFSEILFLHDLSPIHEKLASRKLLLSLEKQWYRSKSPRQILHY